MPVEDHLKGETYGFYCAYVVNKFVNHIGT